MPEPKPPPPLNVSAELQRQLGDVYAVDVSPAGSPPMPAVTPSTTHLAPVRLPDSEGVATYRNLLPDSWAPYALAGSVVVTLAGQELLNPAPWDRARVGSILVNLGGLALAWLTKAPQVAAKPKS